MKAFGALFAYCTAVVVQVALATSNVIDLTPANFDDVVLKSGKPALVEFFAPWCGHCKKLAPIWEQLADSLQSQKDKITIAKVDADEHKSLNMRFGIQGFPTLKYFDGKSDTPIDYDSKRDIESLQAFITKQSSIKPRVKKQLPSKVVTLTDANFDSVVTGAKHVLVEFYAPWCGHCKALAPIYEDLGNGFADEDNVVIAKVDADAASGKATAQRFNVGSYPTLKFFAKGASEPEPYEGGRTEAALVEFLNAKTGTQRAVGGGLNERAGRVPALDVLLHKLVRGDAGSVQNVLQAVEKAVVGESTDAAYYVRALKKLAAGDGYVDKELARLRGILARGGMAPKKVDELTRKVNVLAQFFNPDKDGEVPSEGSKDEL